MAVVVAALLLSAGPTYTVTRYSVSVDKDELRMAGVYSDKSQVEISAKFHELDFSSVDGTWNQRGFTGPNPRHLQGG
ncbi:hypothetical protein OV208_36300 [Corallococcus sp. bb12-1]|uniref:hypothetical protein n=1 Tax=Corallococcus sp. bb12-1 TaxID=2996784 RepID=UPI00227087CE|nr:hypothetical protein [Corallococcus sp. bb12-1]MCY1046823.1 hypothetical protein [Corallococcus sp. bb12-1]